MRVEEMVRRDEDPRGVVLLRDALERAVRSVADADRTRAPARGGRVAGDRGHVDVPVGEDARAGQMAHPAEHLGHADAGELQDRVRRDPFVVRGAFGVVDEVHAARAAPLVGVEEAVFHPLTGEGRAQRHLRGVAEGAADLVHLLAQAREIGLGGKGQRIVHEGVAHGHHLEAGDAEARTDGAGHDALVGHAQRIRLVERRESGLVERRLPVPALADATDALRLVAVVDERYRVEVAQKRAAAQRRVAVEPIGVDHRQHPRIVVVGEVEVEVRHEVAIPEDLGQLHPGAVVLDHLRDFAAALLEIGDDLLHHRAVERHVVRIVVVEATFEDLRTKFVPPPALRVALGDFRLDRGDPRLDGRFGDRVASLQLGQLAAQTPQRLALLSDGGDELPLEALLQLAGDGRTRFDHVVRGGEGEVLVNRLELRLVALGAHGQRRAVRLGVRHVEGVVEVARALLARVVGAEEDDDDVPVERTGLGQRNRDVRQQRRVGRLAQLGGVVRREAVRVEARGEHKHLLAFQVASPSANGGQLDPEVDALPVLEQRARVDRAALRAVRLQQPGRDGLDTRDVEPGDERDGGEADPRHAPLVDRIVADEDDGLGPEHEDVGQPHADLRRVDDGDGAGDVLALEVGDGAVADEDDGALDRAVGDERGGAVVRHEHARDGLAGVGERQPLGLLDERAEGLAPGLEARGLEFAFERGEARGEIRAAGEAVGVASELGVEARVDRVLALGRLGRGRRGGERQRGGGEKNPGQSPRGVEPCVIRHLPSQG